MAGSVRSPSEKKAGGKADLPHFLHQLAAALDNSTIKSLEWHEDGKGILLHTKLYEEEVQRHQELFPELKNLRSLSVLQAWLTTYGFKARMMKTNSDSLAFQHADFRKLPPHGEDTEPPKAEASVTAKQPKKSKKRKSPQETAAGTVASAATGLPPEPASVERKSQRLRPLYQYINYDNPEMNSSSDKDHDLTQPEAPSILQSKAIPLEWRMTLSKAAEDKSSELKIPPSATSGTVVKAEVDKSTQVDIDKMLSVCAAHLVPPLSPQDK
uniref:Chromosome 16 open reading frame 86 n=1 Tax=Salvator merianae TaxID=96440 RepID=A0A8D0BY82_SALMN